MYETVCGPDTICAGAEQPLETFDLVAPPTNPAPPKPSSFCLPGPEPEPAPPVKPPDTSASRPTLEEIDRVVAEVRAKASDRPNAARWAHFTTRIVALDLPAKDRLQLVELIKIMEQEDAAAEGLGKMHRRLSSLQIAMTATIPIRPAMMPPKIMGMALAFCAACAGAKGWGDSASSSGCALRSGISSVSGSLFFWSTSFRKEALFTPLFSTSCFFGLSRS